ncbi:MAG: glycerol kinase GlpK [Clostridia bacterium]|nr:glycerol kinase GlpK [Clostridia bacterium]
MKKYVISLDQGTTSSRAIIFDKEQNIVEMAQKEFEQIYPKTGFVEHNPMDIYLTQYSVLTEVIQKSGIDIKEVAAIGITNQRETTILWDKKTGRPVYNAIVWQCRRTAPICEKLKGGKFEEYVKENTGLLIDAYFSATKIKWILDNVDGAREKAEKGEILFGTVDTWLLWKLTNGKVHKTDYTNASRTMLFNIRELCWDKYILKELNIPEAILPKVCKSSEIFGETEIFGEKVPISGIAGDQQAALFGQGCFSKGEAKNTYGTGCFLLMNTGETICESKSGLLSTIAAVTDEKISYAVEGSIFVGGAIIQWLRDELSFFSKSSDCEDLAASVKNNGGVYVVPAFTGLGAPYWDMYARGSIFGLTRGSGKGHITRACLEAIAYQTKDVLDAMKKDTGIPFEELKVDGGASINDILIQFQADILSCPVRRPMIRETTALGAAYLAGLAVGFWENTDEIKNHWRLDKVYTPSMEEKEREALLKNWHKAVKRASGWEDDL